MPIPILIATPYPVFAELLRISLEENGDYQVRQVQSGEQARSAVEKMPYALAFLDSYMIDQPVVQLAEQLRAIQCDLRIIVIPPDNNNEHPAISGLNADGYLNRPFYLPDLLETVARLTRSQDETPSEEQPSPPALPSASHPWLDDPLECSHRLSWLVGTTAISTALVCRNGQILGQTGADDPYAREVNEVISRYWKRDEKCDIARYTRFSSGQPDSLLYATSLMGDAILVLIFPANVPLTRARKQALKLAHNFFESNPAPADVALQKESATTRDEPARLEPQAIVDEFRSDHLMAPSEQEFAAADSETSAAETGQPEDESPESAAWLEEVAEETSQDDLIDLEKLQLADFLADLPSPDPEPGLSPLKDKPSEENSALPTTATSAIPGFLMPWEEEPQTQTQAARLNPEEAVTKPSPVADRIEQTSGSMSPAPGLMDIIEPPLDPLADTRPLVIQPLTRISELESTSPALSHIYFTCLLIPRLPNHYLTGELADQMAQWLPQICVAFGWRLEGLSIRPEYLQWIVQVSPSLSPGNLIRIIRQRTSQYIFDRHPMLRAENPSGDFWAPGYLIISGAQPPASQLVREFIIQTRTRQGIQRP